MQTHTTDTHSMTIHLQPCEGSTSPAGKLADVSIHFRTGPLAGLQLQGFAIWQRRSPAGAINVTFPARQYSINGERRSFALLRPGVHHDDRDPGQTRIADLIRAAYLEYAGGDTGPTHDAETLADDHGIGWPGRPAIAARVQG